MELDEDFPKDSVFGPMEFSLFGIHFRDFLLLPSSTLGEELFIHFPALPHRILETKAPIVVVIVVVVSSQAIIFVLVSRRDLHDAPTLRHTDLKRVGQY